MTDRKFYKTIFIVTVLSENELPPMSLGELSYECMEGDFSGHLSVESKIELNGKQAADALKEQDSDPEFFQLDDEGNDLND